MSQAVYRIAADVAWVDAGELRREEPEVYVVAAPDGDPLLFEGPAWAVWSALAEGPGTIAQLVARAAQIGETSPEPIKSLVADFVRRLVGDGLVVGAEPGAPS